MKVPNPARIWNHHPVVLLTAYALALFLALAI